MKKGIFFFIMMMIAVHSYSQTAAGEEKSKDFYLERSRHQKTAAWIMLGGGVVLTGVGFVAAVGSSVDYALGDDKANTTVPNILAITGIASTIGSIPMFISAAHNKHKAATLSFDMQKVPVASPNTGFALRRQPAITLKIAL